MFGYGALPDGGVNEINDRCPATDYERLTRHRFWCGRRLGELRRVNGDVRLHLAQLNGGLPSVQVATSEMAS